MSRTRRIAAGVLPLVVAALTWVAFSAGISSRTVLNVIGHWSGWQLEEFTRNANEYMALRPDIDIQFIYAPMDQTEGVNKLLVMMAGKAAPDIIHAYLAVTPEILRAEAVAPMPAAVAGEVQKQFLKQVLPGVTYKGQLYGIPTENQAYVMGYNQRILAESGIVGPPGSWDELRQVAAKLTRLTGDGQIERYGFAIEGGAGFIPFVHSILTFIWSNGGEYIDVSDRPRLNEPPVNTTVQYLSELVGSRYMALDKGLGNGSAAMSVIPPWRRQGFMAATLADYPNLRTTLVPNGAGPKVSYQYGWGIYVSAQSRNPGEAWAFLRWLTMEKGDKGATRMSDHMVRLGSLPTNRLDVVRADFRDDPFFQGFIDALEVARPEPPLPQMSLRQQELHRILSPAVLGNAPPGAALEEAQRRIATILAEDHPSQ